MIAWPSIGGFMMLKEVKCVVWDLDNTIWEGIVLEGVDVKLKEGIAEILETLDRRGILLSVSSKNVYEVAMKKLKEFKIDHYFLYPQINWNAKSSSILEIKNALNIGMDTIVFIDDQGNERDEVVFMHPEVETIDARHYKQLIHLPRLNPKIITDDSARRRAMYIAQQERQDSEKAYIGPRTDFLNTLNATFTISLATIDDLQRAEELTIRTNQLNSTGIQYSYEELLELMNSQNHKLWICGCKDKYGDYGKIGLALVEVKDDTWIIKLILMSCRTVFLGTGSILLCYIINKAKAAEKKLQAHFRRTNSNRQMLLTYQFANFLEKSRLGETIVFENDFKGSHDYPTYLKVIEE